jgi:hypothetical protein
MNSSGETTATERKGEPVTDPQDHDEHRELFNELARRIEANARRARPCRPWLGAARSRQEGVRDAGAEVLSGDRFPAQRPAAGQVRRPGPAVPEWALVRAVMAEVLTRLPRTDLPEHVRERSAVVARAALDEASEEQPRSSKVLRLRDRLVEMLRAGLADRPGEAGQQVLGVVRQLY